MKTETYGAMIERGKILQAEADGYTVRSVTRDGITTPPLGTVRDMALHPGDLVYFFIFDDGRGMILGLI